MNLFDILSADERIIVYSDASSGTFYTWNRSLTLQRWRGSRFQGAETWEEDNIRTLSSQPHDYDAAREAALRWHCKV
jgi:hypothetical protein